MQRLVALITLTAFLLVVAIPAMPVAQACAHKSAASSNDDSCGSACHDESATLTPDDMNMSGMDMDMPIVASPAKASTTKASVAKESVAKASITKEKAPRCRIECGCGCNSSPDKFPVLLTPHIPASFQSSITIEKNQAEATSAAALITSSTPPNIPPPRLA